MFSQWKKAIIVVFILFYTLNVNAQDNKAIEQFIDEITQDNIYPKAQLKKILSNARHKQKIIELMSKPAEKAKPWYQYKKIFLTQKRIDGGIKFWQEHKAALQYAQKVYGVPAEIIVAIIGVETYYGRISGSYRVLDALFTLTFHYPKRAKYFRSELKAYLKMCHQQGIDPLSLKGSYAGAMGFGQFMPSSYLNYAVNFDGKGSTDIWQNPVDAIGSVANYFKRHGWISDEPVLSKLFKLPQPHQHLDKLKPQKKVKDYYALGYRSETDKMIMPLKAAIIALEEKDSMHYWYGLNNFYVITRYNHSAMYAMSVYLLAQRIKRQFK